MYLRTMLILLMTLLLLTVSVSCYCPSSIPAMLWSTSKLKTRAEVLLQDSELLAVLRDSHFVYIFYHPSWSVEQFSKLADVYRSSVAEKENHFDVLLRLAEKYATFSSATIDSGMQLVTLIQHQADSSNAQVVKTNFSDFTNDPLSSSNSNVRFFMVALPEFENSAAFSVPEFGNFLRHLGARLNARGLHHTVIYTALHNGFFCSKEPPPEVNESLLRRKRQINLSTPRNFTYINVENCLLFYASLIQLNFAMTSSSGIPLALDFTMPSLYSPGNGTKPNYDPANTWCSTNSTGKYKTAALAFGFDHVPTKTAKVNNTELSYMRMYWLFTQHGTPVNGQWQLTQLNVTFKLTSPSPNGTGFPVGLFDNRVGRLPFDSSDASRDTKVEAPLTFSYHCANLTLSPSAEGQAVMASLTGNQLVSLSLHLTDFQIQPFVQHDAVLNGLPQFGYPNDCAYFFSIPVLMGLITAFLLLSVLIFAFFVFASVKTSDRFDDTSSMIALGVQEFS